MGGGLMQLVSIGAQDIYLISNPQITLFKNVYHKYSNFSIEPFEIHFDGNINFGGEIHCTLPKDADLISKMHLIIKLNSNNSKTWGYVKRLGFAIIDEISLLIGGETIDKQYGEWLNIWYENNKNNGFLDDFNKIIGDVSSMTDTDVDHPEYKLYIPLQFWFCKNYSLSLPVLSLNYNSVEVRIKFKTALQCINYKGTTEPTDLPSINNAFLLTDYIFLDSFEREKFIKKDHEYLIEQVQINNQPISLYSDRYDIKFHHPCKTLFWITNQSRLNTRKSYLSWSTDNDWETAKNNFAKLVWLASRDGLDSTGENIVVSSTFKIGDIPAKLSGGNSTISTLADKVTAYLLFYNTSGSIKGEATLDNVFLIDNDITYEDMTVTVSELNTDTDTTTAQAAFFDLHKFNVIDYFNYGNFVNGSDNPVVSSQLKLNGYNRFSKRKGSYFNYVQPFQHFKNSPSDGINIYNFAINPDDHQPSGACNFTRIENIILDITIGKNDTDDSGTYFTNYFKSGNLKVYSNNYNILVISQGIGNLAYKS